MNFKLTRDNDLMLEHKNGLAGAAFVMFGGRISNGIMENADEIAQTIKNEFLLYLNETLPLLGRGTDWFAIFRNSKSAGIREFQQEVSRIILSVRSVNKILDLAVVQDKGRKISVKFRVDTRSSEIAEGEIALN
jgi:hypothetical protein